MAASERWYFTKERLNNTPSRSCGIDGDKELSYRQQAANFIQDMGQRLQVTQLCINTAIVYMHRFYVFHSFSKFHRTAISTCALFLAAKVEEQPRKLEHVIKVAHMFLHRDGPPLDTKSEAYLDQTQEIVVNENIMLQTLGFDIAIDHPHTYVVKWSQLVRASKDLAQTSYFMATNSLHLTTMCLQYKPTLVACVCIHLACKWSNWEIPHSYEGREWYFYIDRSVTLEQLEELTSEFLAILDKCPSRLKRKILSGNSKDAQTSDKDKKPKTENPGSSSNCVPDNDRDLETYLESKEFLDSQKDALMNQSSSRITPPMGVDASFKSISASSSKEMISVAGTSHGTKEPSPTRHQLQVPQSSDISASNSPSKKKIDGHSSISLAAYREMKEKDRKDKRRPEVSKSSKGAATHPEKALDLPHLAHSTSSSSSKQKALDESRSHPQSHHHGVSTSERSSKRHGMSAAKHEDINVNSERSSLKSSSSHHSSREQRKAESLMEHSNSQHAEVPEIKIQKSHHAELQHPSIDKDIPPIAVEKMNALSKNQHNDLASEEHKRLDSSLIASIGQADERLHNAIKPKEEPLPPTAVMNTPQGNGTASKVKSPAIATKSPALATKSPVIATKSPAGGKSRQRHGKTKSPITVLDTQSLATMPHVENEPVIQLPTSQPTVQPQQQVEKRSHRKKSPAKDRQGIIISKVEEAKLRHLDKEPSVVLEPLPNKYEKMDRRVKIEKTNAHRSEVKEAQPQVPSVASISGGLKITIPKDKIMLGSLKHQDESQKEKFNLGASSPPREALKIKIPKVKISTTSESKTATVTAPPPANPTPATTPAAATGSGGSTGLKLVITKDRFNSGTYSSSVSQKTEKESRKRERHSKEHSSNSSSNFQDNQNAESGYNRGAKIARTNNSNTPPSGRGRGRKNSNQGFPPHHQQDKNGSRMPSHHYASSNGKGEMHAGNFMQHPQQFNIMAGYARPDFYQAQQYYNYQTQMSQMGAAPIGVYPHQQLYSNLQPNPHLLSSQLPPLPSDPPLPREPPPPPPPLPPGDR